MDDPQIPVLKSGKINGSLLSHVHFIIDREAGEIMHLIVSVCLFFGGSYYMLYYFINFLKLTCGNNHKYLGKNVPSQVP